MQQDDFLESAKTVALKAGLFVKSHLSERHDIQRKSKYDFVSEVDQQSELIIRTYLAEKYPDHLFFGEEEISSNPIGEDEIISRLPKDRYVWVIDPVDGTTNFLRGIPQFAISIALVKDEKVILGVVYDISLDELYFAKVGEGAFCNGRPIHVAGTDKLDDFIVSTSFPAAKVEARGQVLRVIDCNKLDFTSLRIWNCASLAITYVATGRTDAHIELGIHLWDFAAGKVIAEEAGGCFSDVDGKPFHLYQKHVLVSNGKLHNQIVERICGK